MAPQRRCSICRRLGHTKRSCPSAQKTKKTTSVSVRVSHTPVVSEHVIDLKKEEKQHSREEVPVYHEVAPRRVVPTPVDFGALVRAHVAARGDHKDLSAYQSRKKEKTARVKKEFHFPKLQIRILTVHVPTFRLPKMPRLPDVALSRNRAYALLGVLLLVALLPFPVVSYYNQVQDDTRNIVEQSTNGFLALQSSTVSALHGNVDGAGVDAAQALQAFSTAQTLLEKNHGALISVAKLVPILGAHVASRQYVLDAGQDIALGNAALIRGVTAMKAESSVTGQLALLRTHLDSALPLYTRALKSLGAVDASTLPPEYEQIFGEVRLVYAAFVDDLHDTVGLMTLLQSLAGTDGPKTYLVIGQNTSELRPTGGFMGSFAVVSVQKGKVTRIEVPDGGTYDVQGQLDQFIAPPVPLQIVNKRWELQDANWFPDFPSSAKKVEWFYEHARHETVDGVIAVNGSVLERLIGVMGDIVLADRGTTLSKGTALDTIQAIVLGDRPEGEKPKAVLGEALGTLLGQVSTLTPNQTIRLVGEINSALREREIQIYLNDPKDEQTVRSFGWTGDMLATAKNQDYLMVNTTNISGGKSDKKITQEVTHEATVHDDGTVDVTLVIKRTHTGTASDLFYGAANLSYLRVYVPEGAILLGAHGFDFPPEEAFRAPESWYTVDSDLLNIEKSEVLDPGSGTRITHEFGKTAFGNWMAVGPGEEKEAYLVYRLPFRLFDPAQQSGATIAGINISGIFAKREASRYSLFIQKQSGISPTVTSRVIYPSTWHPVWRTSDDVSLASNGATVTLPVTEDKTFGIVMEHN